jgi:hypothetical protein
VLTPQSNYATVGYRTVDCLAVVAGPENWGRLDPFHTSPEASRNFKLSVTAGVLDVAPGHRTASIPSGRRCQLALKVGVRAGSRVDCQRQGLLSGLFASGWSALTGERVVGPI